MRKFSAGRVRAVKGRWQLVLRWQEEDGSWHETTRLMPYEAGDRTRQRAEDDLRDWRDGEIRADTVSYVSAEYERRFRELAPKESGGSPDLDLPFLEYAAKAVDSGTRLSRSTGRPASESTVRGYHYLLAMVGRVLPDGVTVKGMDAETVKSLVVALEGRGYSDTTVHNCMRLVRSVLEEAVRHDGLGANPCDEVSAPSAGRPRLNSLPSSAAEELAVRLAGMDPTPAVTAAQLALGCGMRGGELAALRLSDIEAYAGPGIIHVRHAEHGGKVGPTKTEGSVRDIPMNGELREAVMRRERALREGCTKEGTTMGPDSLLLGDPARGCKVTRPQLSRQWSAMAKAMGIRGMQGRTVTLHDLRHTFATYALAHGMPVKDVQRVMGHSSAAMTLDVYASADPEMMAGSMEAISRV